MIFQMRHATPFSCRPTERNVIPLMRKWAHDWLSGVMLRQRPASLRQISILLPGYPTCSWVTHEYWLWCTFHREMESFKRSRCGTAIGCSLLQGSAEIWQDIWFVPFYLDRVRVRSCPPVNIASIQLIGFWMTTIQRPANSSSRFLNPIHTRITSLANPVLKRHRETPYICLGTTFRRGIRAACFLDGFLSSHPSGTYYQGICNSRCRTFLSLQLSTFDGSGSCGYFPHS